MQFDKIAETAKNRVIAHFDLDAFYVAAERELNPSLVDHPVAVSQYNPHGKLRETHSSQVDERLVARPPFTGKLTSGPDGNGSMIAVSYEARACGVQRGDRGMDAIKKCHDLHIVQVPVKRGKADLTMYRNASSRVMDILIATILASTGNEHLKRADIKVEKASIDEIYIDMTIPATKMADRIVEFQKNKLLHDKGENKCHRDICADTKRSTPQKSGQDLWKDVIHCSATLGSTTVGGIEVMSDAALAANGLSKIELRKGSKLQILDSNSKGFHVITALDAGSQAWWNRPLLEWSNMEICLACGSALAAKARAAVRDKFRIQTNDSFSDVFTLSGGVSSNKTLAKLASGLKKPNRQTIINPMDGHALTTLFHPLPLARIRGLGGKFGNQISEVLDVQTVGDLSRVPLTKIQAAFPPLVDDDTPTAQFLFNISRGMCTDEVSERTMDKSMSSGKTFRGALAFPASNSNLVSRCVENLCGGLIERLEEDKLDNNRGPTLLVLSAKINDVQSNSISRSSKAPSSFHDYIRVATKLFYQLVSSKSKDLIFGLTVSATNFIPIAKGESSITAAFKRTKEQKVGHNAKNEPIISNILSSPKMSGKKRPLLALWSSASKKQDLEAGIVDKNSGIEVSSTEQQKAADVKCGIPSSPKMNGKKQPLLASWSSARKKQDLEAGKVDKNSGIEVSSIEQQAEHITCDIVTFPTDAIDKNVFSQLPSSIQSEIRLASMSKIGKGGKRAKRTSSMSHWLTKSSKAIFPTASPGRDKKSSCRVENDSSSSSIGITHAQIDPSVMAELPHDIQMMVNREVEMSSKIRKSSRKRLEAFFHQQS